MRDTVKGYLAALISAVTYGMIPLFMILYVDFSSPGFFRVMYETFMGRIVMTLCLATYLFALYLSPRIAAVSPWEAS